MKVPEIKEPILVLNPPAVVQMRKRLEKLENVCTWGFSSNDNWREKAGFIKKRDALSKQLKNEIQAIRDKYDHDMIEYKKDIELLKKSDEIFQAINPIESISVSEEIASEQTVNNDNINSITGLEI